MNLGAFTVVAQLERLTGSDAIRGLRGLGRRAPFAAVVLTLSLFSLAGIPPLAGFLGKILLLEVGLEGGLTWLVVVAVLNFAVALYYYLLPVVEMFLRPAETSGGVAWPNRPLYVGALWANVIGTVLIGVSPSLALDVVRFMADVLGS